MVLISKKKISYQISSGLREYLFTHGRELPLVKYSDLLRYDNSIPLIDEQNVDTLWETVFFPHSEVQELHESLRKVYSNLQAHGDVHAIEHLFIDRIDLCPFGNSKPFRIRIVNKMNDNFDYFYVKIADASRIYGLELEHLLSPNKINYIVHEDTLIEEHIAGIPGDQFIDSYLNKEDINKIRIAKEFVKFNERCFVRLLGDMHSSNFVIDITPDIEQVHYRIRAIDFDQQCYEGSKKVYMPQFFKQNLPYVKISIEMMTPESVHQYQLEERSLIRTRMKNYESALKILLAAMSIDEISLQENVEQLREELAEHHGNSAFNACKSMGDLVGLNLKLLYDNF